MVDYVTRGEELERSRNSVFAERQEELDAMTDKMPRPLTGNFPFLMEIKTGVVHPYTPAMAERSDLVVGCYNLEGSFDPEDADPYYNPQSIAERGARARRVSTVGPQTAAEKKAAQAAAISAARRDERAKVEAEFAERLKAQDAAAPAPAAAVAAAEEVPVPPEKPATKKAAAKKKKDPVTVVETTAEVAELPPVVEPEPVADDVDLQAAFEDALK